jgi:mannose-6-phosphate isomerase-like protein (cupin superfamily)
MGPVTIPPTALDWRTRPHADGEPARHVAELSERLGTRVSRVNVWRYEPGAVGRRHVHAAQEETFVVLDGTLSLHLGEPAERVDVPWGGIAHVPAGTPQQSANHGDVDLLVLACGAPPDHGAEVLEDAVRPRAH